MAYELIKLAPGSYDLLLNGDIIGSVVRNTSRYLVTWSAELLLDVPPEQRPTPFIYIEHEFTTLEEVRAWLGSPGTPNIEGR